MGFGICGRDNILCMFTRGSITTVARLDVRATFCMHRGITLCTDILILSGC